MAYEELTPARLLAIGPGAPEVVDTAWCSRWDRVDDPQALCAAGLPATVDFETSGTTGEPRRWRRLRAKFWQEAGMLAALLAPERPEAVVSFVPPLHLFGALSTVLVPAHLRVPVWYRRAFLGRLPDVDGRRVAVSATPWIFRLLLEHAEWVGRLDRLVVLCGGAPLPATARQLLDREGPDRMSVVEVLGSTEAGGIATRRWRTGEPPDWTLFPDVRFHGPAAVGPDPEPLRVESPRLAFRPGTAPPPFCVTDDRVRRLDARHFVRTGRDGRLVKVNGRRIDLDAAEHAVREVLDCADLALVPVGDDTLGEHLELVVVLHPGTEVADIGLAAAFVRLGVRPRRVRVAPRIERSALGKTRRDPTSRSAVATS